MKGTGNYMNFDIVYALYEEDISINGERGSVDICSCREAYMPSSTYILSDTGKGLKLQSNNYGYGIV